MNLTRKLVIVVITLASASVAHADLLYTVTDLGFNARALNNQGQVVGSDGTNAILWDQSNGSSVIGPGAAYDINDFGRAVGFEGGGSGYGSPGWIYDGNFGSASIDNLYSPTAINNLGQVAGSRYFDPPPNGAYLWDPVFGFTPVSNVGGGGIDNRPQDVNDRGEVVGTAASGEPLPFYWQPGDAEAQILLGPGFLDRPDGQQVAGSANAINNSGVIAASLLLGYRFDLDPLACDGRFCQRAAIYIDLEPMIIALGGAYDINEAGWVVGGSFDDQFPEIFSFLWSESFGLLNLNDLISPYDPLFGSISFNRGSAINDRGWIIADNRYLLTPVLVREPDTLALLSIGLAAMGFARRRQKA